MSGSHPYNFPMSWRLPKINDYRLSVESQPAAAGHFSGLLVAEYDGALSLSATSTPYRVQNAVGIPTGSSQVPPVSGTNSGCGCGYSAFPPNQFSSPSYS